MSSVFTLQPAALPVPAAAGGVSAAVDVRAAGGPLTFGCAGNQGDKIRVQGSPDGVNLWGDVCVLNNNGTTQTPQDTAFGFIRLVRDKVDPTPGVVPVAPLVSVVAQPQPGGYQFVTTNMVLPVGDGVGNVYDLRTGGLTNEITLGSSKSIVCSAFDPGDSLTLETSVDGAQPWSTMMELQQGKILAVAAAVAFIRIRRARVPSAGPRVGVDGATAAFMGYSVSPAGGALTDPVIVANYNASAGDLIQGDPTGGAFNVTLPAAAAAGPGGRVQLKNKSDSANLITVVRGGADTIDGVVSVDVGARESAVFVSDGVSQWMLF